LYSHSNGVGEYVLFTSDVPDVLWPSNDGPRQADAGAISAAADGAIGWHLRLAKTQRIASVRLSTPGPATRLWLGSPDSSPLTRDQLARFEAAADAHADALNRSLSPDEAADRLRRLELAADPRGRSSSCRNRDRRSSSPTYPWLAASPIV
jgi:hypothetical protein